MLLFSTVCLFPPGRLERAKCALLDKENASDNILDWGWARGASVAAGLLRQAAAKRAFRIDALGEMAFEPHAGRLHMRHGLQLYRRDLMDESAFWNQRQR
jgi:hypothetical protein